MASICDFMVSSIRFTSGWWMIGDCGLAPATGGLPCTRVRAHSAACWKERSATA